MAARPSWRGQLRLALVSCPIRLIPATTAKDQVRFHKLNRATGNRLRQQMIDSETEDVITRDDTIMGYEFEKGRYVTVKQEELDRALSIREKKPVGVLEAMAGEPLHECIIETGIPNLWVLPVGAARGHHTGTVSPTARDRASIVTARRVAVGTTTGSLS